MPKTRLSSSNDVCCSSITSFTHKRVQEVRAASLIPSNFKGVRDLTLILNQVEGFVVVLIELVNYKYILWNWMNEQYKVSSSRRRRAHVAHFADNFVLTSALFLGINPARRGNPCCEREESKDSQRESRRMARSKIKFFLALSRSPSHLLRTAQQRFRACNEDDLASVNFEISRRVDVRFVLNVKKERKRGKSQPKVRWKIPEINPQLHLVNERENRAMFESWSAREHLGVEERKLITHRKARERTLKRNLMNDTNEKYKTRKWKSFCNSNTVLRDTSRGEKNSNWYFAPLFSLSVRFNCVTLLFKYRQQREWADDNF